MARTQVPADQLPKDQSGEVTTDRPQNRAGVYEHKAAGKRIIIMPDPHTSAQADAVVRMGFEWVAPPPTPKELLEMQQAQAEAEKKGEVSTEPEQRDENAVTYNGTAERRTMADVDAQLKAERARAEAAEQALAEALSFKSEDETKKEEGN